MTRLAADPTAAGRVVRYAVLPGILPRARLLFNLRFHGLAFALACVFQTMRLLPGTHPYLNPANYGRYGILQVIAAGAARLVLSRKNIDQIIVFFALISGLVIMALQIVALLVAFTLPAAQADDVAPIVVTTTSAPCNPLEQPFYQQCASTKANDVALLLMDRIFGIPNFFGSCLNQSVSNPDDGSEGFCLDTNRNQEPIPWPFHKALHSVFEFYSLALLTVGVIILLYFIFVVVAETAETGTPFGKRFNSLWAPLRIVVAFGLLIPFGAHGLNGAQHLVLYAAKFGSAMASNGWYLFMDRMLNENSTIGEGDMTGRVQPPTMAALVDFFATAHFCKHATELTAKHAGTNDYYDVAAYLYKNGDTRVKLLETTFSQALGHFNGQSISIAFGVDMTGKPQASRFRGNIMPVCGVINIPATVGGFKTNDDGAIDYSRPENQAAYNAQRIYYNLVSTLWKGDPSIRVRPQNSSPAAGESPVPPATAEPNDAADQIPEINDVAREIDRHAAWWFGLHLPVITESGCTGLSPVAGCSEFMRGARSGGSNPTEHLPTFAANERRKWINTIDDYLWNCSRTDASGVCSTPVSGGAIYNTADDNSEADYNEVQACLDQVDGIEYLDLGWGGAGAYYNCIASSNGIYVGAVLAVPSVVSRPALMELVRAQRARGETGASASEMFCPEQGGEAPANLTAQETTMASAYCSLSRLFTQNLQSSGGNIFIDTIHFLFGTSGLETLRNNPNTHPLAALTVLGKGVIDSVITKLGIGLGGMGLQILGGAMGMGEIGGVISGFMFSLAGIGLTAGFILYYVVPFMPFMYFFFALGIWAKTIFEAMVGVPLWALAHIRIDGQGLPGDAAQNGYHLLLEIFIRPILIVFGLLASVTIFSAMALTLNDIYCTVTGSGCPVPAAPAAEGTPPPVDPGIIASARSAVDEFFFLILYTIIIYLMAVSSFKLIDLIPQSILRWMGSGAQAFGDQASAQVDQMTGYIAIGGSTIFPQVTQGVQGLGQGLSSISQGMLNPRT